MHNATCSTHTHTQTGVSVISVLLCSAPVKFVVCSLFLYPIHHCTAAAPSIVLPSLARVGGYGMLLVIVMMSLPMIYTENTVLHRGGVYVVGYIVVAAAAATTHCIYCIVLYNTHTHIHTISLCLKRSEKSATQNNLIYSLILFGLISSPPFSAIIVAAIGQ